MDQKTKPTQIGVILSAILMCAAFLGCTQKGEPQSSGELRILTWSDYLVPSVVEDFEKKFNAKVKLDYFSSNEELLAKVQSSVQAGGRGYDVIFPSDYMVGNMKVLNLLEPLDKSKLNVVKAFQPRFQSPSYDPKLEYSVPFSWGTTGVAFNRADTKGKDFSKEVLSWKDFFESPIWARKITLLDDSKEVLHAALLSLGKKWSDLNAQTVTEAFDYLKKCKKQLKIFTPQAQVTMENGECTLCQAFSGDAIQVMKKKSNLGYLIPKEGATIWSDNLAIPRNSGEKVLAHEFIAALLEPQAAAKFTEMSSFATAHRMELLPVSDEIKKNTAIYPDSQTLKRLDFLDEKPELTSLIDKLWTELRSL
jgi:spermidine/putrescine transport system substrate-binding protein